MNTRRAVVTGIGPVSPLGIGEKDFLHGLFTGRNGIRPVTLFDPTEGNLNLEFIVKNGEDSVEYPLMAGEVKDFDPTQYGIDSKEARRTDRATQFGVAGAKLALDDAGLVVGENADPYRAQVRIGTGMGGINTWEYYHKAFHLGNAKDLAFAISQIISNTNDPQEAQKLIEEARRFYGAKKVSPLAIPGLMPNAIAANISMKTGIKGQSVTVNSACASGGTAIGDAYNAILLGYADVVVTGGAEAGVTAFTMAGFRSMNALSVSGTSMPYDQRRNGFVMGEGAGIFTLEELEHAKARGARIYAEILGYGASSDANHITQPDVEGKGMAYAMRLALERSGVQPSEVSFINGHGTSTPFNDAIEAIVYQQTFGDRVREIPVHSLKGSSGHALGGAAGLETIDTVLSIYHRLVPGTPSCEQPLAIWNIDSQGKKIEGGQVSDSEGNPITLYVPRENVKLHSSERIVGVKDTLGFGGHNEVLVVATYIP